MSDHREVAGVSRTLGMGMVTVTAAGLEADTQSNVTSAYGQTYASARGGAERVEIAVGPTRIVATGLEAWVSYGCVFLGKSCYFTGGADFAAAYLSVNGMAFPVRESLDMPLPGVGTLHLATVVQASGPQRLRALWLEGSGSVPDVIIGEAAAACCT